MNTNRRKWLQQIGLGALGLGLGRFNALANDEGPANHPFPDEATPIRLNANENPYGPSPLAREAFAKYSPLSNRYNWPLNSELSAAIARKNNLLPEQILLAAGSTEILDLTARFAALQKGNCVVPHPSFTNWTRAAAHYGLTRTAVPLNEKKQLNPEALLSAINSETRLLYVCNPNNPTGTILEHNTLAGFVREAAKKTLVLVDEAYIEIAGQPSLAPLVAENKNIVITRTFSKIYGLAGARVGYAIAHPDTINAMANIIVWANGSISVASAAAALASLTDEAFLASALQRIKDARHHTLNELARLQLTAIPSYTNFIYFSLAGYAKDYALQLKQHNISGNGIIEETGKWTRISIGTMEDMKRYIQAIQ